ncbi:MAG: hypothetical protein KBC62_00445 [Candidatus Pacebacteria bacterium]|jgi:hypothetical protein|nr:hypothetical protein [Candidatus Paceibacterota bacterium]
MTIFYTAVTLINYFAISLGVGASTVAIVNFFSAIKDGAIDDTERRMLGVAYGILRVAMITILVTTLIMLFNEYDQVGIQDLTTYALAELLVIFVLYVNALLMSAHLIPSTFGPALQAGNWYVLGMLAALFAVGLHTFTITQFLLGYISWLILAVGIVNGIMAAQTARRSRS